MRSRNESSLPDIQRLSKLPCRLTRHPNRAPPIELLRSGQRPNDDGVHPHVPDEIGHDVPGFLIVPGDGYTNPRAVTHRVREHTSTETVERLHESNSGQVLGHRKTRPHLQPLIRERPVPVSARARRPSRPPARRVRGERSSGRSLSSWISSHQTWLRPIKRSGQSTRNPRRSNDQCWICTTLGYELLSPAILIVPSVEIAVGVDRERVHFEISIG